jgi:glycerol-1-phosphate dehydrogenase [NAD(P)+]
MMGSEFPAIDPADLEQVRSALRAADPEGRLAPIGLRRIVIGQDALPMLPAIVTEVARGPRIVLVMDRTPMRRAGRDLKPDVVRLLEEHFASNVVVIGADRSEIHGEERDLEEVKVAVNGAGCVVALGSGTITDLCKEGTRQAGNLPLVVVQTAASVNAFSDNMAVLVKSGTKRTMASRWVDALLIDLQILADTPLPMTQAGFGDLMAVWTAPADWYLASLVGMDSSYHAAPVAMLREPAHALLGRAAGLAERRLDALDWLARVLTLSGLTMGATGKTAPLSGTEHLVSHLIDMEAIQSGRPVALHGAQVAVATILAAAAWHIFLNELDPWDVALDRAFASPEDMESAVRAAFATIDPAGRVGEECWNDYRQKLQRWHTARPHVEVFLRSWTVHRTVLQAMILPPEQIAVALHAAGAPTRFSDLDPPVPPDVVRWALLNCHLMRNRFTLADLLFSLGRWNTAFVERLLEASRVAGGGL